MWSMLPARVRGRPYGDNGKASVFTESVIEDHPSYTLCSGEDFNSGTLVMKEVVQLESHSDRFASIIVAAAYGSLPIPSECTATDEQAQIHLSIMSFDMETPVLAVRDS